MRFVDRAIARMREREEELRELDARRLATPKGGG